MSTDTYMQISVPCDVCGELFTAAYDPDDKRWKPFSDLDSSCGCTRKALRKFDSMTGDVDAWMAELSEISERLGNQIAANLRETR